MIYQGITYLKSNRPKESIQSFQDALKALEPVKDRFQKISKEACCYSNMGLAYLLFGDFEKASNNFTDALKCAMEVCWDEGTYTALKELGDIDQELGFPDSALKYYGFALDFVKKPEEEIKILRSIAIVHIVKKRYIEADKLLLKVLNSALRFGDYETAASALNEMGIIKVHRAEEGQDSKSYLSGAVQCYENSISLAKKAKNGLMEIEPYANLGNVYILSDDTKTAVKYFKKALRKSKAYSNRNLEMISYNRLAQAYFQANRLSLADKYCKKAISVSEALDASITEDRLKIGFANSLAPFFQLGVKISLNQKKEKQAFEYAERSKSGSLTPLLATSELEPTVVLTEELAKLLADERNYIQKLRSAQNITNDSILNKSTKEDIESIRNQLRGTLQKILAIDPEYVSMRVDKKASYTELARIVSSQKREMFIVEYFIAEDEIVIFVLSSEKGKLDFERVPVPLTKLNEYIKDFMDEVLRYRSLNLGTHNWLNVSDYLLKPIAHLINSPSQALIYFIPHGILHFLPLQVMTMEDKPLIHTHPVAYLNNVSLLRFLNNKGSGKIESCASFGVAFEEEADKVAKLFGTTPYLDYEANKHDVPIICQGKDIIHFSCHGEFDLHNAMNSRIILYDNPLFARDIFNMKLNAELVCLSACQSGFSYLTSGDELIGLVRSFLYAGASSVIASLWSVNAAATRELLLDFYSQLKESKEMDKATALQQAQINLMKNKDYSHEYFWAPFKLFGDWH